MLTQKSYYPDKHSETYGHAIFNDFIEPQEEHALVSTINRMPWNNTLRRRTQHYGYEYDYRARSIDESNKLGPLPIWLEQITKRIVENTPFPQTPEQAIINEYQPAQGISKHTDAKIFGPIVASLSLLSDTTMTFYINHRAHYLELPRRSLLVLTGISRNQWQHAIQPKHITHRRISITFRQVITQSQT